MVVEVERTYRVEAPIEAVWEQIADPAVRAAAISVVDRFEQRDEVTVWHIQLPIPFVSSTIPVRTWDVEVDPPRYVKFVGESRVMEVTGEHELTEDAGMTSVRNKFVVDGKVPTVETFFKRNFDAEIERMKQHVLDGLDGDDPSTKP